jgi:hypothetical protein
MEGKEILDFLGVEASNLDEFKAQFGSKYYTEKQIHDDKSLLGKFTGKTVTKIKQNILKDAREAEIPFTNNEFDDADIETVVKTIKARQDEMWNGKLTEVQAQVGKSGEEAVKPYLEKISKYEQSLADEKKAKQEIASQFDQFKLEADGKIKSTRISYFQKDLMGSIQLDPVAQKDPLKMKGWESHIKENFKFDYDEQDNPIILDKTGSKIKNPKKADEWLSPKDVLTMEADKLGLIPKNPQGGQPAFRQTAPIQSGTPPAQPVVKIPGKGNRLAPGMEKYLSK